MKTPAHGNGSRKKIKATWFAQGLLKPNFKERKEDGTDSPGGNAQRGEEKREMNIPIRLSETRRLSAQRFCRVGRYSGEYLSSSGSFNEIQRNICHRHVD